MRKSNSTHRKLPILALIIGALATLGAAITPAAAQSNAGRAAAQRYANCLQLAQTEPDRAFDAADTWRGLGGGGPARHCAAVALIHLGHPGDGALRLEALAHDIRATKVFKAQLLAQSGQAWLLADDPSAARSAFDAAINLLIVEPEGAALIPDLLVDRAQAFAAQGSYVEAIGDLDRALTRDPSHVAALVFRGTAYRFTDNLAQASADITQALRLAPDHPEALLESGILHRLAGRNAQARLAWRRLLEIAPNQPSAVTARANLQRLDVNVD